jgi:hypothetical protein
LIDQRALPCSRRARQPDDARVPAVREQRLQQIGPSRRAIFDRGNGSRPAGVREAEALEVAEGAPLMLVERTAYARSGEPLEFARDLFRGDRTRVVVWTSELAEDT